MRQHTPLVKLPMGLLALFVLAGPAIGGEATAPPVCQEVTASPSPAASYDSDPTGAAAGLPGLPGPAGGLRAYVDPRTGSLVAPPAGARALELSPELQNAFSTSSDGLVEVARPSGGVIVRLGGRFMSATVATIGADGKARIGHGLRATVPAALAKVEDDDEEGGTDED